LQLDSVVQLPRERPIVVRRSVDHDDLHTSVPHTPHEATCRSDDLGLASSWSHGLPRHD
jgi:hypothetical protein